MLLLVVPPVVVPDTMTVATATFVVSNENRATMTAVPAATAFTSPDGDTVATVDCSEFHCTCPCCPTGALVVN